MSIIGEYLQNLFQNNKAIVDDRTTPILTFNIPTLEGQYGLFPPNMTGWYHMVHVQLLHGIISMIFGVVIYKWIIPNRGTAFAYLLGWGILIPLAAYIPFWFIEYLDIYNRFTNLPAATVFTCVFFRCIEAMYDTTTPKYIEDSLYNYVLYYSSLSPFIWDPKTKTIQKVKVVDVIKLTIEIVWYFCISSILVSWMITVNFQPFQSNVDLTSFSVTADLFTWEHIANAYIHTWTLFCVFKVGFEASGLGENFKGLATYKVFDQPLTKSRSPTEFWTLRWNIMIHKLLKNGIFLPSKKFFINNTKIAIIITFIVSGLYHDYAWQCMFYDVSSKFDTETGTCSNDDNDHNNTFCYQPIFGRVTGFFVVVGITMILERPIYNNLLKRQQQQNTNFISKIPSFVIAQILLLPHLPFVHWYGGDWMMGGFFEHLSIALFRIRRI